MNNQEPKIQDVLEAIGTFANRVEERFEKLETKVTKIEATMVTKDYLDEKLADLRGDLVLLTRKEDTKLKTLVATLEEKKVIDKKDRTKIVTMEPFAELIV